MREIKAKILIVEDSKTQAMKLEYLLYSRGFLPLIANDGITAIEMAKQQKPDLIISDVVMPEMSGFEFCKFIKTNQSTANIPLILLTALSETRDIIRGLECGACNFISKPYKDDDLIDQINNVFLNQKIRKDDDPAQGVKVRYQGVDYTINAEREKIIDILISTYDVAVKKNADAQKAELELKQLNLNLEQKVKEKTAHLSAEIKERKQAQIEIDRLSNVVHQAKNVIVLTDLEGNIEYANPRFTEITGYLLSEVIGKNPRILKSGKHSDKFYQEIWERVLAGKEWRGEIINKKKNGELYYESASIFDIRDSDGTVRNLAKIGEDITKRKEAEERSKRLYDSLMDDIELASSVQSYLLPEWLVHENEISVTSVYTPSEKVGGDIFDVIPLSKSQYVVYIGDISGHGVQAALIMTAVKSTINMLVNLEKANLKPYYIINKLNEILSKDFFQSNYLTIIFCLVDLENNKINYLNAGHPALIEHNKYTYETRIIDKNSSIPVGWLASYQYQEDEETTIDLSEDSVYFLYTDGLFECLNSEGLELGVTGFTSFLKDFKDKMNSIILPFILKQKLINEDYDLTGDDFTLLTLRKFKPSSLKNSLLVRFSVKNKAKVAQNVKEFVMNKCHDDKVYSIVNSLIANHVLSMKKKSGAAQLTNTVLIQLKFDQNILVITFWEKLKSANNSAAKFIDNGKSRIITDCNFNKYPITLNFYDDITESIIYIDLDDIMNK